MSAPATGGAFRRLSFLLIFGLGGGILLLSLGIWQLERLQWKNALIAEMEARAGAPAVVVTGAETPGALDHRAAVAVGAYPPDARQIRYLTSIKGVGPGFRLIAPFKLANGARILIDRGFAPEAAAPRGGAAPAPPTGEQRIEGRLRWPQERSSFTPEPNRAEGLWFAREVDSLAEELDAKPVLLVQGASDAPGWPKPLPETLDLPNDHLGYAITWFALAAIWLVMSVLFGFRRSADR